MLLTSNKPLGWIKHFQAATLFWGLTHVGKGLHRKPYCRFRVVDWFQQLPTPTLSYSPGQALCKGPLMEADIRLKRDCRGYLCGKHPISIRSIRDIKNLANTNHCNNKPSNKLCQPRSKLSHHTAASGPDFHCLDAVSSACMKTQSMTSFRGAETVPTGEERVKTSLRVEQNLILVVSLSFLKFHSLLPTRLSHNRSHGYNKFFFCAPGVG